jgi:hypothetical protein
MRIAGLVTMAALQSMAIMSARAGQADRSIEQKVIVYLENDASVPNPVLFPAKTLAAEMFTCVGVQIDWRAGGREESQLLQEGQSLSAWLTRPRNSA